MISLRLFLIACDLRGRISQQNFNQILVSTNWFKPSVFQTDKENKKCAGGAHSKRTVLTVSIDPTSFSWWWFSFYTIVQGCSLRISNRITIQKLSQKSGSGSPSAVRRI